MMYLDSIKRLFLYYKNLGEKAIHQLNDEDLFRKPSPQSNSIDIIVKHLWGNMLSRWTDYKTSDGEKEWRNRDSEFESTFTSKEMVMQHWEDGWSCLLNALDDTLDSELGDTVFVRNQPHSIMDTINRQLAHYSYHVGQIITLSRMYTTGEWQNLSIPLGASKDYNQKKFSQPNKDAHFTDDWVK